MSGIQIAILISHKNIALLPSSDGVGAGVGVGVGVGAGVGAGAGGLTTICFPCFLVFFSCSSNSWKFGSSYNSKVDHINITVLIN